MQSIASRTAEELRETLIMRIKEGATVVYATQRLDELSKFNANILVLRNGRLIGGGSLDEIVNLINGLNIEIAYLGRISEKQRRIIGSLGGIVTGKRILFDVGSMNDIPKIARYAIESGINITSINFVDYNLRH